MTGGWTEWTARNRPQDLSYKLPRLVSGWTVSTTNVCPVLASPRTSICWHLRLSCTPNAGPMPPTIGDLLYHPFMVICWGRFKNGFTTSLTKRRSTVEPTKPGTELYTYSPGSYLVKNKIDGVFLPRSPVPSVFLGSDLVLQCRTCF